MSHRRLAHQPNNTARCKRLIAPCAGKAREASAACARDAAVGLRVSQRHGWRLQWRPALKRTSYTQTPQAQKLVCIVACSGAVFRYPIRLLLHWLLSLLPVYTGNSNHGRPNCLPGIKVLGRANPLPLPQLVCLASSLLFPYLFSLFLFFSSPVVWNALCTLHDTIAIEQ